MRVPRAISLLPGVRDLAGEHPRGPRQDLRAQLASSQLQEVAAAVPRVRQFLLPLCQELQLRGSAPHSAKWPFEWSPEAKATFQALKEHFTSAPMLQMPDPALQFVVEVDMSGVGTVLSQRVVVAQKRHP